MDRHLVWIQRHSQVLVGTKELCAMPSATGCIGIERLRSLDSVPGGVVYSWSSPSQILPSHLPSFMPSWYLRSLWWTSSWWCRRWNTGNTLPRIVSFVEGKWTFIVRDVRTVYLFSYMCLYLLLFRNVTYFFDDEDVNARTTKAGIQCTCPPEPREFLMKTLDFLMYFFLVEWCARVLTYVAEDPAKDHIHQFFQWLSYLTSSATIMDALAIFPYFFETLPNTFVSLRLLRLFRIFQLLRLGQHNTIFSTLTNMLQKSLNYLRLLVLILAFGGAFFGSIVYWVERGTWGYHEASGKYLFLRLGVDGVTEEPSPFRSIPDAFWWFMVTATTVGYGGKWQFRHSFARSENQCPNMHLCICSFFQIIILHRQSASGWPVLPCWWASSWLLPPCLFSLICGPMSSKKWKDSNTSGLGETRKPYCLPYPQTH